MTDQEDRDDGPPEITLPEMLLLRQAERLQWGVPDQVKTEALFQLRAIILSGKSKRYIIAAARTLAMIDRIDCSDERTKLAREKFAAETGMALAGREPFDLASLTAEAERIRAERRERETETGRGDRDPAHEGEGVSHDTGEGGGGGSGSGGHDHDDDDR